MMIESHKPASLHLPDIKEKAVSRRREKKALVILGGGLVVMR